jgi:hypothetical protein
VGHLDLAPFDPQDFGCLFLGHGIEATP